MSYKVPNSVAGGAKILDKAMPGWHKKIDLAKLDMKDYNLCILGQLYGGYGPGYNRLFNNGYTSSEDDKVFGDFVSVSKWKKEISQRLNDKYPLTFLQALEAMHAGKKVRFVNPDGRIRVLAEVGRKVMDVGEFYNNTANPLIFSLWDYKFAIVEDLTFGKLAEGTKYKFGGQKFVKVKSGKYNAIDSDLNGVSHNVNSKVELC